MADDVTVPLTIICTGCGTKLTDGFDRDGEKWGRCSGCGREDTMDIIIAEATSIAARRALSGMFGSISSPNIKVTSPAEPETRWKPAD